MSVDPYPPLTREDMRWFYLEVVKAVGRDHRDLNVGRRKSAPGLVLVVKAPPELKPLFTSKVCRMLTEKVQRRTGIEKAKVEIYNLEIEIGLSG
jgi:hypothetical protein